MNGWLFPMTSNTANLCKSMCATYDNNLRERGLWKEIGRDKDCEKDI